MTLKKAFIYTVFTFLLLSLLSYIAMGQARTLSMKEAVGLAISNNRDIKTTALDIDRDQQQTRIARSQLLPVAGISGQVAHYFNAPAFFGFGNTTAVNDKINFGRFGGRDQLAATLFLTQPIYTPAGRPGVHYSKLQQEQSRFSLADKEIEITALVRQTYIQLLVLNERIKLQKESLARNQKALQDAKSLLAQGRALRVDTLRAYTSVKNLEPDLLKLTLAVDVSKQQLKTLAGINPKEDLQLSDSLTIPAGGRLFTENEVYRAARQQRPDLKSLELEPQMNDQQVKLAAATGKPSISATGQYLVQSQSNKFNYVEAYYPSTTFVGVQLAIPLFNGFSTKARVQQAKIEKKQSILKLENASEQLRAEVKQVVANLLETTARIQTRTNVKETALLSYDMTQYRYEKGVASRLELTDAELALTTAQSNYLEAVYDYLAAQIALDVVMGTAAR